MAKAMHYTCRNIVIYPQLKFRMCILNDLLELWQCLHFCGFTYSINSSVTLTIFSWCAEIDWPLGSVDIQCSLVKPRNMKLWLWFGRFDDAEKTSVSVFAARAISCSLGYCHVLCLQVKVQSRLSLLQLQMKAFLFSCP